MSIEENITAVQERIDRDSSFGDDLRAQAIAAIYGGLTSDAWKRYMSNFARTPEELARLTSREGDGCHPYIPQARCYLVANATCLPGTNRDMLGGIEGFLDKTLS
jgi:hypothetical protein